VPYLMTQRHILILDCTTTQEPSEGRLLKDYLEICKLWKPSSASSLYFKVRGKRDFLNKLDTDKKYDIVHISAHGLAERSDVIVGNGTTWWATPEEIQERARLRARLVFVNACLNNRKAMREAFSGCKYFLAPNTSVRWDKAALFAILFYQRYIIKGSEMKNAFEYARTRSGAATDYPDYWE